MIALSGTVTDANGDFYAGSKSMKFWRFCLGNGGNTNSTIHLPSGASVLHFADSSSVTWSNEPLLMVDGWNGSLFGGGPQQIIFGNNAGGLTAGQLGKIQFQNPPGLAAGTSPPKIPPHRHIVPTPSLP